MTPTQRTVILRTIAGDFDGAARAARAARAIKGIPPVVAARRRYEDSELEPADAVRAQDEAARRFGGRVTLDHDRPAGVVLFSWPGHERGCIGLDGALSAARSLMEDAGVEFPIARW